eukprot:gene32595-biopygen11954
MFSITVPNVDLPVDLGFTQDFDLKLAIGDDGDVVVCGRHWTLFTTVTQPMADFEAAYGILQQTAMVSCAAAAAAEPPPLDIDDSCMPFDKLTYAVVVALEELVDNSCCPNTRVFAWLYAKHLRAADMDFMDLLQTPAIANMASTALDAWFVRHPMFRAQAHEAQDLLITVLDDYTPSRPRYEPYWDFDLKLAIGEDGDVVVCGRHWTLFTTVTQPMADFEAAYGILQQTAMVSCAAAAAAEPPPLDIGVKDAMLIHLKVRWKESHYCEASVFSTKLVKAFFVGKQGTEWKETGRIDTNVKYGVGTVNVNYSSDIDVNLNFNGEILHNDLDRIVLIFKSIKDYHYQRFKRNFTDMFDINIYGSHFGMLNNPKSAKSKEEIYLISNDPQQRLFAMDKVLKELAKIPPGDLINRMNMNINTSLIKKTSTLDEQNAITHLVEIIETAMKQKDDFDKATRDFYTVYDKLKTAIFEACETGPKLCGTVNGAIKTQKKNS